ncbi:MAG: hypothetical protein ACE5L6_02035 [Candidatus Bathyarchaeia archaeon]
MAVRQFHRVSQLLTLYLQRSWQGSEAGFPDVHGRHLLPSPLPVDDFGVYYATDPHDYDEISRVGMSAGETVDTGDGISFLAPQLFADPIRIMGTGYAVLRLSSWVAGGATVRIQNIRLRLYRITATAANLENDTSPTALGAYFDNNSTAETKRSIWTRLEDLNFELNPAVERLGLTVNFELLAVVGGDCYGRLLHKAGQPESYIQLPVVEA